MSKLLANLDAQITAQPIGAWIPGDPNNPAQMALIFIFATKNRMNNKFAIVNNITWTVIPLACQLENFIHVTGASSTPITATALKVKFETLKALREEDFGFCTGQFLHEITGVPLTCTCKFTITDAGQDKVKGL